MNENGLPGAQFRRVDQCLPCRQRGQRHRRSFHKIKRLWLDRRFSFVGERVLRVAATPHHIRVNRIADFQFANLCSGFLDNAGNVITGNQGQIRSKEFRVLARTNHRVDWVHARGNHSDQNFVLLRLRARRIFILQHFRPAVFMNDNRLHCWCMRLSNGD